MCHGETTLAEGVEESRQGKDKEKCVTFVEPGNSGVGPTEGKPQESEVSDNSSPVVAGGSMPTTTEGSTNTEGAGGASTVEATPGNGGSGSASSSVGDVNSDKGLMQQ